VIALTANAMAGDRERYLAAGLDDHVSKPIEAGELYEVLGRWLGRGSEAGPEVRPTPVLDRTTGLARVRGREDAYRRILAKFRERADAAADAIRGAVATGRIDAATGLAHSLKGAAGNVAAVEVHELAATLETTLRGGVSPSEAAPLVDDLAEALVRARRAVDELLAED
jgi:HPt (histidine-containing phosphotransfer) domain-containing protein